MAQLGHNAPVMSLAWLDDDAGIILLGGDGIISKWIRTVSASPVNLGTRDRRNESIYSRTINGPGVKSRTR